MLAIPAGALVTEAARKKEDPKLGRRPTVRDEALEFGDGTVHYVPEVIQRTQPYRLKKDTIE